MTLSESSGFCCETLTDTQHIQTVSGGFLNPEAADGEHVFIKMAALCLSELITLTCVCEDWS